MKFIKNFDEFLNEKLKILRGSTDDETEEEYNRMTPDEALEWSVDNELPKYIKKSIVRGANANFKDYNGCTPLMYASYIGDLDLVKILIEKGADVNIKNIDKKTALMIATQYDHLEIIKILIENGVKINTKDIYGDSALTIASGYGFLEIYNYLKKHGAKE